jgi:hypothetical protein
MSFFFIRSTAAQGGGGGGGDLVHGETASISGSGFGAVGSPAPVVYDDFSTGTLDALVTLTPGIVGTWEGGSGDSQVYRSNAAAAARGVHTRGAYHDLRAEGANVTVAALCLNETFTDDWYIDWWHKVSRQPANTTTEWTRNFKTFRFYDNTGDGDHFALTHIAPGVETQTQFYTRDTLPFVSAPITEGGWAHFRLRFRIPQTFASTDVINFSRARAGQAFSEIYDGTYRGALGTTQYPTEFRLGDYWAWDGDGSAPANDGADIYTSTVHIQRGWSRVELGNHATYASATITEIQRTTSRSDTLIEYIPNKGLLSTGTVYEYVFNASNTLVQTTARTIQ